MAGKSKLKEIPMFPTRVWNENLSTFEENGTFSHIIYDGEVRYGTQRDGVGRLNIIQPTLFPNTPFQDELKFTGFTRGRSAAGATFTNAAGQEFYMFLTDFTSAVPLLQKGVLTGTFKCIKRGTSFGVQMQ